MGRETQSGKQRRRRRFQRLDVVLTILIAGWAPSILMFVVAYGSLTRTVEQKILRDRQAFVQLIAHLVNDDLSRTAEVMEYYQTQPIVRHLFEAPDPVEAGQEWLNDAYYTHPRMDGMFLTDAHGRLLVSIPSQLSHTGLDFASSEWLAGARATNGVFASPIHARLSDQRKITDLVAAIRAPDHSLVGFVGASVLVERIGRRLSAIELADQSKCQVIDQNGQALFTADLEPNPGTSLIGGRQLLQQIDQKQTGHLTTDATLYSFAPIGSTGWTAVVTQPRAVAYKPVHDLTVKMTVLEACLIVGTVVVAGLAGRFYRRQSEAAARIEREVAFNDKILANMPIGIALIDPRTRRFLQANEAFTQMAERFGGFVSGNEITEASYADVNFAPPQAIEKVLSFGTAYQLIEQPLVDRSGETHFVNINLLRLQDSQQRVQGVLYLVEDKTRDMRLRQDLISANASKDQFLALLSHELRNPLSPVIAMVSELELRAPAAPEVRQALAIIRRNVELEARLIDDLLDVTRISKGKLQLAFEETSVHEVLHRAYEICRAEIIEKKLDFEFRLGARHECVSADPARLQQVFWNLIKNAVKFTPEGGQIIVETSNPIEEQIEIRTIDSGIGIEPAKLEKVFNAFEQGQSSITRRFGGLGLGLAISKAMVRAHGGRISVESDGQNRGASFIVTLNTIAAQAGEKRAAPSLLAAAPNEVENDGDAAASRGHLLVVDDHADTCLGMKMLLERRGYRITLAHSVTQAIEKALAEDFDLLISDIGLPDRSGYELMKELRAHNGIRGIALSGFGMESDINKSHDAGFSEHLTKPINFDRLDEAIRRLLASD